MKKSTFILILTIFQIFFINYISYAVFIDEKVAETPITKGVTHTNIKRFTTEGWYNINLLRIDLNEPTVSLKTLFNKNTSQKSTVLNLAMQDESIVGAINADFFTTYTKTAACEGLTISDSQFITSPSNDPIYATFAFSNDKTAFMDHFTFEITVTSKRTEQSKGVFFYNKNGHPTYLKVFDSNYGGLTPGSMDDGIEVVVENNIVTEILSNKEGVKIPENGYVLHDSLRYSLFLADNFEVGDEVILDIKVTPDISDIKEAAGGGTLLLKNGEKANFTLKDSLQPMTACGVDKTGKIVYFLTVDGRQSISRGMTFSQTADFLKSLGCYNAISFDGGGSTTMVAKFPSEKIKNVNVQSSYRAVINAIGVSSQRPMGSLSYLKLLSSYDSIFVGDKVEIWTYGYDEYYNEYDLSGYELNYSADIKGNFDKNIFYPAEPGKAKITVSAGNVKETITVNVLDNPVYLESNINKFNNTLNEQSFFIYGYDKDGYSAFIPSNLLSVEFIDAIGTVKNNKLILSSEKRGALKLSFGEASTVIPIGNYKVYKEPFKDKFYKRPTSDGYTFGVFGNNTTSLTLFTNFISKRRNSIASSFDLAAFRTVPEDIKTKTVRVSNYGREDTEHSLFLKLDNSKGSIIGTKSEQWDWLLNVFKKGVPQKNVFLTLPLDIDKMTDKEEVNILISKLKENLKGKNIFIISYSDNNTYMVRDEIRYITVSDIPKFDPTDTDLMFEKLKYAKFTITGDDVSFEFLPMF